MSAQIKEKREVAKGTLLVIFDLLGREVDGAVETKDAGIPEEQLLPERFSGY